MLLPTLCLSDPNKKARDNTCPSRQLLSVAFLSLLVVVELSGIERGGLPSLTGSGTIGIDLVQYGLLRLATNSADGGAKRDRTADLLRARQALSQLSYSPVLLVFFALRSVALVARSVTYWSTLLRSLLRAPCSARKIRRKTLAWT